MIPKFRAWHKENKKMHDVSGIDFANGYAWLLQNEMYTRIYASKHELHEIELTQWTGLKDAKRVDIFEGDILRTHCFVHRTQPDRASQLYDHNKPIIRYLQKPSLEWWLTTIDNKTNTALSDFDKWDLEVIGNVWANPELLEAR